MEFHAPAHWACVDFISDLHLQAREPATVQAWQHYVLHTTADAVFMLGDVFEVWVGDDILTQTDSFERQCAKVLKQAAQRLPIFIMRGNRDFLMGQALMNDCGCTLLEDPTVLTLGGERWLLTHGDALCLDDTDYLRFRSVVRSAPWQTQFLDQPLAARVEQAREMRAQSEARKRTEFSFADVDTAAAQNSLQTHNARTMIHGHTHRPDQHPLTDGRIRYVLSDWDMDATPPRAEVLRLHTPNAAKANGVRIQRLSPWDASTTSTTPQA
jgi:UDP-2,3-diacylglucosamine hydrolase